MGSQRPNKIQKCVLELPKYIPSLVPPGLIFPLSLSSLSAQACTGSWRSRLYLVPLLGFLAAYPPLQVFLGATFSYSRDTGPGGSLCVLRPTLMSSSHCDLRAHCQLILSPICGELSLRDDFNEVIESEAILFCSIPCFC